MKFIPSVLKKMVCLTVMAAALYTAHAQVNIIPQPVEIKMPQTAGAFVINSKTPVSLDAALRNAGAFFSDYLKKHYGFSVNVDKAGATAIDIRLDKNKVTHTDGYALLVDKGGVHITGNSAAGAFYGIQSLIQLLPVPDSASLAAGKKSASGAGVSVPYIAINDYPRFAYRGMHLDVSRHFFTIPEVKRYIDFIALHKMNQFHWHLTDDQGWRIQINKYPRLTQVGAYRSGTIIGHFPGTGNDNTRSGGFYTQQEVKEIIAYAADRYITVVPEIEMPGHASAAIAAFPELSCFPNENTPRPRGTVWSGDTTGKHVQQTWGVFPDVFCPSEKTFSFLQDVLDEVIALFPSKYIHIGGDECPKDNWKRSEFCQQLIREKNLKDEHGLQSYFIQRIEKYLNGKGRSIIGWDEILEGGLAPNATVMSWRGEQGGIAAAQQKHDVVMTPTTYAYLDYSQSRVEDSLTIGGYLPIQKVYGYEPIAPALAGESEKYILGAQGNLWTEYIATMRKLEYMIFPRMTALSEVFWSPREAKDWNNFQSRLGTQFRRYQLWGASASRAVYDPRSTGPAPQK